MFAAVKDDLQMQPIPAGFWKQLFEISFRLNNRTAVGEPPSLCQAMNVGINGKGCHPKALAHYDRGGFMANSW
jgi:hypothetical protein